jgi:hypothetical protein
MTTTVSNIIPAKFAENAQTTQYTAVNCKTIIDKFTVTNISAGAVTFSANLVVVAGSAGSSNLILKNKSIAVNETYSCPELVGQTLDIGGFISTIAGSASALTIRASGREIT